MSAPEQLPATPEEAYRRYRKATRPFRRTFGGILTRKEADRFIVARLRKQERIIEEATSESE